MSDVYEPVVGSTQSDYTDSSIFEINYATKKLAKITEQTMVAGEDSSQYICFQMARYYDGIDLSTKNIQIIYQAPYGFADINQAVNVECNDENLRFGWIVPGAACYEAGMLAFAIEFTGTDYVWKSRTCEVAVEDGLNGGEIIPEPTDRVWYIEIQSQCAEAVESANTALEKASRILEGIGAPTAAATAADMIDEYAVYVYTGNETGYTYGDWYYYDSENEEWVDGGVYASTALTVDRTLTRSGQAADAKVTGDSIRYLNAHQMSDEIKLALLNCFQAVAWSIDEGQELYDALATALNPPENITSISAVYTQTGTVYTTDNITTLRNGLVVTANYSDGTSDQVYSYSLTGTLTAGTSTITVQYAGKSTTFTVTVTDGTLIYELTSSATFTGNASETIETGVVIEPTDRELTILMQFNPDATIANGGFIFYAGQTTSPYRAIGIKTYTNTSSAYYPFQVCANSDSKGVVLTNVEYGEENYVVMRYIPTDTGVSVFAYNPTNGLITGTTQDKNIVADNVTLKIGASSSSSRTPYKGTISQFKVYSRALTDEEVYAFLNGEAA